LTKEQHALGHTIRRTAEESLYWTSVVARWKDKASFAVMKQVFAKKLPPLIGGWIMSSIRKSSLANAWGHGIGRHRLENIYAMGVADLDAIAVFLGDKPFLFGDSPTSYDAAVYGQVANALAFPVENPVLLHARSKTTLVDYCERISKTYFTDPP
jgi:glutathione S-transferase